MSMHDACPAVRHLVRKSSRSIQYRPATGSCYLESSWTPESKKNGVTTVPNSICAVGAGVRIRSLLPEPALGKSGLIAYDVFTSSSSS
ncbi:hypothetical protein CCR75_001028 [Bremia lactucae]|uniref:Uncharacterized protein n=1 Tax=Bremia lactucae TaxID=4779 RepID=A0A976II33_BRELC|nr:hypothetical protein CCR75_001028 [Bremia lactucae]